MQDVSGTITKVVPDTPVMPPPALSAPPPDNGTISKEILRAGDEIVARMVEGLKAEMVAAPAPGAERVIVPEADHLPEAPEVKRVVADRKPTTEELTAFRERYEKLAIDLQMAGLVAEAGQTAARRVRVWFLAKAGCEGKHLTFNLWTSILGFMDQKIASDGIKGLVELITKETV